MDLALTLMGIVGFGFLLALGLYFGFELADFLLRKFHKLRSRF